MVWELLGGCTLSDEFPRLEWQLYGLFISQKASAKTQLELLRLLQYERGLNPAENATQR